VESYDSTADVARRSASTSPSIPTRSNLRFRRGDMVRLLALLLHLWGGVAPLVR
jgi:hypothetical protein